jgi:site-specific DNA-adenine methylase
MDLSAQRLTFPYPGAKGKLAPSLVKLMPNEGKIFFEPFAGRGNVFFASANNLNFSQWWLNDIQTAPFFHALKKVKNIPIVPERTKEEFYKQKFLFEQNDSQSILLEPYLTFSGGGYKKGGFGGNRSAKACSYAKTLFRAGQILKKCRTRITQIDWELIDFSQFTEDDFIFFDPPYFGADVRAYSNKFDHLKMVGLLKKARFRWMLTEYEQPFYLENLGEPNCQIKVQLACDGNGTKKRIECVWKNF